MSSENRGHVAKSETLAKLEFNTASDNTSLWPRMSTTFTWHWFEKLDGVARYSALTPSVNRFYMAFIRETRTCQNPWEKSIAVFNTGCARDERGGFYMTLKPIDNLFALILCYSMKFERDSCAKLLNRLISRCNREAAFISLPFTPYQITDLHNISFRKIKDPADLD